MHLLGTGGYHPSEERHTACYMLAEAGVVLDAGTGFFRVRDLLRTKHLDVFLSHPHLDHCMGLTFLLDVLFQKGVERVTLHGLAEHLVTVRDVLHHPSVFPVPFRYELRALDATTASGEWKVRFRQQAHPGASVGYRFDGPTGSFAYVTDLTANPGDAEQVEFVRGVDLLIHECNFHDGMQALADLTGHSTPTNVATVAKLAGAKRLVLIHVTPIGSAEEIARIVDEARAVFPTAELATDRAVLEW